MNLITNKPKDYSIVCELGTNYDQSSIVKRRCIIPLYVDCYTIIYEVKVQMKLKYYIVY